MSKYVRCRDCGTHRPYDRPCCPPDKFPPLSNPEYEERKTASCDAEHGVWCTSCGYTHPIGEHAKTSKPTNPGMNPKDAVGIRKAGMSVIPAGVVAEVAVAMLEGALKYGRHNYRVAGVRASVYYDATMRHLMSYWEGEDFDPDSGLSHVTKAIASLVVLRDAMQQDMLTDDRPPKTREGWMRELNEAASDLLDKYPNPVPAMLEGDQSES